MGALASALGASLSWGLCDFLAGLTSRKIPVLTVVRVSGIAGLGAIALVVLGRGRPLPDLEFVLYALAAGVLFAGAIAGFYRALAVSQMGRVAPIVAAAPAIPAVVGQLTGEPLTAAQAGGVALILVGVSMAASESRDCSSRSALGVGLALGSTACFGVGILALDEASASDPFWAALVMRFATIGSVAAAALAVRRYLPAPRDRLPTLCLVGLLDAAGVCLFAVATQHGQIGIVAAAAGLVPLVIVLLARIVLDERLRPVQYVGAAAAVVGVGLVSTG